MASRPRQRGTAGGPEPLGATLTRLRMARGYSQLRLAERLCVVASVPTVTRHEVSRWEREERVPGRFWLGWLAVVLDAPLEELEAAVAATRRALAGAAGLGGSEHHRLWRPPTADELLTALDRAGGYDLRELAHAWLAGPSEPPPEPPPDPAPPSEPAPPPAVAPAGNQLEELDPLQRLGHRLAELRRMDDLLGGADLAALVDRELRAAIGLLRTVPADRRRRTLRLVAQCAQLAGWVHADADHLVAARRAHGAT